MNKYEALSDMGIQNPQEISKYTLRQEGHGDVLKIYYKRKKGSFLPNSRKYKFGRSIKTVLTDGGKQEFEDIYEISPFLLKAVAELDSIVKQKHESIDRKQELLDEIDHLEKVFANKLAELRDKVKEI
ncbi:MAG: DUF3461 family protein [Gammaproteobacteria bacterium]|nr:DUF3461 family protein [Gammaproteobacteria bacterium]